MWSPVDVLHGTLPWGGAVSTIFSPAVVDFAELVVAALSCSMSSTFISASAVGIRVGIGVGIGIGIGVGIGVGVCI